MINRKASKKHCEVAVLPTISQDRINFERYLENYGDRRLMMRLAHGRKVKPCGKECWEYGFVIAESTDHGSFKNFKHLMNDKDFLLAIATITPNPTVCDNYFYIYVNQYLKKDSSFKLELLKQIYMNENVYLLNDINVIVNFCKFQKENEILLSDIEFKREFMTKFNITAYETRYDCFGNVKNKDNEYDIENE